MVAIVMILHGLFGPSLAPKNLATTLSWVHFRGALVLTLLVAGNFFCLACPFMLVRNAARKFFRPVLNWPRRLRNKWLAIGLFVLILFLYELFDLWSSPWWTAWLIISYFIGALIIDGLFKQATFCKFVCPIGQFNFVASTLSPLEVKVRDQNVCTSCRTKDCIRGSKQPGNNLVTIQRGCELALFQPRKTGNLDCTFCLDCVQACPHDNVGILARVPAEELLVDPFRSGLGFISRRKDLAALIIVFSFGALLNAFGMVSPIYALEQSIASRLGINQEAPVLGLIFGLFLVLEPLLLIGFASWLTYIFTARTTNPLRLAVRYCFVLVPLVFGIWLAHYTFHFLLGLYTFIPVVQNAAAEAGWAIFGPPYWTLVGLSQPMVHIFEYGFLTLGLTGSLIVGHGLAKSEQSTYPGRIFVTWASVSVMMWGFAIWLMSQPIEMRGTLLGGN